MAGRPIDKKNLTKLYQANMTDRKGKTGPVRFTLVNFDGTPEEAQAKWEELHVGKKLQSIKEIRNLTDAEVKNIQKKIGTASNIPAPK